MIQTLASRKPRITGAWPGFGCGFFLIIFVLFSISLATASDNVPRLFSDEHAAAHSSSQANIARRLFKINKLVLGRLATAALKEVAVKVIDADVTFKNVYQKRHAQSSTWVGVDSTGNNRILLTIANDHLFGRVKTAEGTVVFEPTETPFEIVSYRRDPDYEIPLIDDEVPTPREDASADYTPMQPPSAADDGARLDVMILYTDGMAAAHPGAQIDTRIQYLIDVGNDAFANSNIDTEINLVYSAQVTYPDDSASMNEALYDLTDNEGVFTNVENLRTTYGADQVTLLRKYVDEGCGLAWVHTSSRPALAYAVVHDGSKPGGWYCSDRTYVHEFGHNLGCAHDIANSSVPGWFSYSYGYQNQAGLFYTVMAYSSGCSGCTGISYFSNPDITYNGYATGTAGADNATTINFTRTVMAQYRSEIQGSVTVTAPNGSENWEKYSSYSITWNSFNLSVEDNVKIDLYKGGEFNAAIAASTPNDGSYSWSVPLALTADTDYRIRISSVEDAGIYDESDDDFTISDPNDFIEVTRPDSAITWRKKLTYEIRWVSSGITGNVRIELLKGGALNATIAASTSNDGSHPWTIPESQADGSDYSVKITSVENDTIWDESDEDFSIAVLKGMSWLKILLFDN